MTDLAGASHPQEIGESLGDSVSDDLVAVQPVDAVQPGRVLVREVLLVPCFREVSGVTGDLLGDREGLACVLHCYRDAGHGPENLYSALDLRGSVDGAALLHARVVPVTLDDELRDLMDRAVERRREHQLPVETEPEPLLEVLERDDASLDLLSLVGEECVADVLV